MDEFAALVETEAWVPGEDGTWWSGEDGAWTSGEDESAGPGGGPWWPRFGQGCAADVLPPGPCLAALTERAICDLGHLSDDELIGVLQATRRLVAREQYKQVLVTAEFARRRHGAFEDAAARGVPVGCRPGGFPGEELAIELVTTRVEAGHRIDDALDLAGRLPRTLAGMAAGMIDAERAGWIALYTRSLTPEDAATADAVLADAAPELRADQVARRAAALEKKLAPEAARARREHARQAGQRVEARRELSGNASLSGREMDTADVLASKAYLDALALRLRRAGVPGSLGSLRVLALADLTQGRNPLDRLTTPGHPAPGNQPGPGDPPAPGHRPAPGSESDPDEQPGPGSNQPGPDDRPGPDARPHRNLGGTTPGAPAPVPAQVNLIIPAGTLLGWSTVPAQAGPWGLLDHDEARIIAEAAARHPATRWCATLTRPDGTALAHACAPGHHPRLLTSLTGPDAHLAPGDAQPPPTCPDSQSQPPPPQPPPGRRPPPQPPPPQLTELLHRLDD